MKHVYLLLFIACYAPLNLQAQQCPRIVGIMANGCGTGIQENRNEFIILINGNKPLNVNDLNIILPQNGAITASNDDDFAANTGAVPTGGCISTVDDGAIIPPNIPFVIFMSNLVDVVYDFSSLCEQYGSVYLLYRNLLEPSLPTFLSQSNADTIKTVTLAVNNLAACYANFTWKQQLKRQSSRDGDFYRFPEPVDGKSVSNGFVNNGCASPVLYQPSNPLSGFAANYVEPSVQLNWTTAMELDAVYFEVNRSIDGYNFANAGTVKAQGAAGSLTRYSYNDPGPILRRTYYRLRIVDRQGNSVYSRTISVRAGNSGITLNNLYPNPVTDVLIVDWTGTSSVKTQLSIRSLGGKILQTNTVTTVQGFNQYRLNTAQLSPGQYFLSLDYENDNIVEVFVKR
ncbi:T9SS type A sorting domain-containing protein [Pseudoflavitalea rhizosphaerae]|uniref:T9SS type A sorting domain-containing protein n=1 Tax=Pseudoflavitalea rhizosphaerae TaxID=1884793 RepID=UPI000F8E270B|nr:T9SS type A sorting domain-containing protein [Pseudoflavitalea rhizosphaerae]